MKETIYTTYAPDTDITFIMMDTIQNGCEYISTECLGWYFGEEDEEMTKMYAGKLKAYF